MNEKKKNMTTSMSDELYQKLASHLLFGQRTQLMVKFCKQLERDMDDGETEKYLRWLYNDEDYVLKGGQDER